MTSKKIYNQIRKVSLRRMIWPLVPIIASLIALHIIPFEEMLKPVKVSSTEDAIQAVEDGHVYLEVELPRLIYSGYNYMKDSDVYGEYYYDLVNNSRCVFYLLEPSEEESSAKVLYNVTKYVKVTKTNGIFDNMLEMFSNSIDWTSEGVVEVTEPYVLSEKDYHYMTYSVFLWLVLLSLAYGAILFVYNLIFVLAPWVSPKLLYSKIQYEGKLFKINAFVKRVANEMEAPKVLEGDMYVTEHFFVNMGKTEFCIIPIDKIRFAYEHSTLKSFFGIHLDVTYTLHLKCSKFIRYHITKKNMEQTNAILEYFKENNPDILIGYTNENKVLAKELIKRSTRWFKR